MLLGHRSAQSTGSRVTARALAPQRREYPARGPSYPQTRRGRPKSPGALHTRRGFFTLTADVRSAGRGCRTSARACLHPLRYHQRRRGADLAGTTEAREPNRPAVELSDLLRAATLSLALSPTKGVKKKPMKPTLTTA